VSDEPDANLRVSSYQTYQTYQTYQSYQTYLTAVSGITFFPSRYAMIRQCGHLRSSA
jgi:hypothetical protein